MVVIPLTGNISWRNPPYVTISMILINIFVFFFFQMDESAQLADVYLFYFESGLADIELPRYVKFVDERQKTSGLTMAVSKSEHPETASQTEAPADLYAYERETGMEVFMRMESDASFMHALYAGKIIFHTEEVFGRWQMLRTAFEEKKDQLITYKFGLIPARLKPYTLFTCMFLHGGFGHLLGNMIFLWMVGCLLEMGCGRWVYGIGYVMVGLCASLFFFWIHSNSYLPMIGASGAISGLMGAMTVLYGLKRIKVFISTGFYFDTLLIPAIVLLPFWVGNEVFQYILSADGQVAYMAHVGGLMGGAVLGFAAKHLLSPVQKGFFEEPLPDTSAALLEEALSRIGRLDYDGARKRLLEYLEKKPEDIEALKHLFYIKNANLSGSEYSKTAARLLNALVFQRADEAMIFNVFAKYCQNTTVIDLPMDLTMRLIPICCRQDHFKEAGLLVDAALHATSNRMHLPTLLLRAINTFEKYGQGQQAVHYKKILMEQFPLSQEARMMGKI